MNSPMSSKQIQQITASNASDAGMPFFREELLLADLTPFRATFKHEVGDGKT
jgi:hypothetical protein